MTLIDVVRSLDDKSLLELLDRHNSISGVVKHFTGGILNEQVRSLISQRSKSLGWVSKPSVSSRYTPEQVIDAFKLAKCWSDIYRYLGLSICDHNKAGVVRFAEYHQIEVPIFSKLDIKESFRRNKKVWQEDDIFCVGSKFSRSNLRRAVIKFNVIKKYECSRCGILPTWFNEELTLELDHINGIHNDNRKLNLRWLCPNCHTQTHTYKGKNRKNTSVDF